MRTPTSISIEVPRPLTEWEMDDVKIAVKNILDKASFFYAGSDDIGDEIVRFLGEHQVMTNLEEVIED